MQVRTISVAELLPAPYNPRKPLKPGSPGYRRLERSLREFDLVQPLVWNTTTRHVVSGHQRLDILKAQGVTEVDVVVVELSLEKEMALNVALNNSLVGSEWDAIKLIDVVRELQQSTKVDVALTGFDADELRDLLLAPADDLFSETDGPSDDGLMHVQFEVPADDWEAVRADLDPVLAQHGLRVHVRGAGIGKSGARK